MAKKKKQRCTKKIGRLLLLLLNFGEVDESEVMATDNVCDFIDDVLDTIDEIK